MKKIESENYPLGGMLEPYDIEREREEEYRQEELARIEREKLNNITIEEL